MDKEIFKTKWVKVIETPKGFQFLERRNKDSVAIFITRQSLDDYEILVRYQPMPLDNTDHQKLYPCPVTGSLEKDPNEIGDIELTKEIFETARREVLEETGYDVPTLNYIGKYIVGTQTNETVYMFHVDVTGLIPSDPEGDGGYHESISKNIWEPFDNLRDFDYSACKIGWSLLKDILNNS